MLKRLGCAWWLLLCSEAAALEAVPDPALGAYLRCLEITKGVTAQVTATGGGKHKITLSGAAFRGSADFSWDEEKPVTVLSGIDSRVSASEATLCFSHVLMLTRTPKAVAKGDAARGSGNRKRLPLGPGVNSSIKIESVTPEKCESSKPSRRLSGDPDIHRIDKARLSGQASLVMQGGELRLLFNGTIQESGGDGTVFEVVANCSVLHPDDGWKIERHLAVVDSSTFEVKDSREGEDPEKAPWEKRVETPDSILTHYVWHGDGGGPDDRNVSITMFSRPIQVVLVRK